MILSIVVVDEKKNQDESYSLTLGSGSGGDSVEQVVTLAVEAQPMEGEGWLSLWVMATSQSLDTEQGEKA
jgi:hypothetical protein